VQNGSKERAVAVWISLLRAINLGSHNKVNMPSLREALDVAGFRDVRTYVQSGNVVAASSHRSESGVCKAVAKVVAEEFSLDVPVIARTPHEWRQAIDANPFGQRSYDDPKLTSIVFLPSKPTAANAKSLEDGDWDDDEVVVNGREVYLWYARNVHRSKLTPTVLGRRLGLDGTARNWRTVLAIRDLLA
jgi:uncharacterized protein (DUF1697 family)